jgi:SAM-dependent methyltransferase
LALTGGETVLELACGPGVNFPLLVRAIGPAGGLVGLDYSEEMLAAARERARDAGWRNVELVQGDAATVELPLESFDAALCIVGLSVVPDHEGAIERVRAALKGGGRFVVLDGRLDRGLIRFLGPVLEPLLTYVSNAGWERDLVGDLERALDRVSVDEVNAASLFIVTAHKAAPAARAGGA